MTVDYRVVGERIRNVRKEKGITQKMIASYLGVSTAYASKIESGTGKINLKRLAQISECIGVPLNYLITGTIEDSKDYLSKEFQEVLNKCTPNRQRAILKIAKIVENLE